MIGTYLPVAAYAASLIKPIQEVVAAHNPQRRGNVAGGYGFIKRHLQERRWLKWHGGENDQAWRRFAWKLGKDALFSNRSAKRFEGRCFPEFLALRCFHKLNFIIRQLIVDMVNFISDNHSH